jgi:hypothetical protein
MLKLPKLPFRKKQEERIAAKAHEREENRAVALLGIAQDQAKKADNRRQSEETHEQIERYTWTQQAIVATAQLKAARRLNCYTGAGAIFALLAASGVIWSVLEAKTATIEANRAWLAVVTAQFIEAPTKAGDPILINVPYDNTGRSPALSILKFQKSFWVPGISDLTTSHNVNELIIPDNDTCSRVIAENAVGVVWPNGHYTAWGPSDDLPIADADFFSFRKLLSYHGCFQYRTFGATHNTAFCFVLTPVVGKPPSGWVWVSCPGAKQNFAD